MDLTVDDNNLIIACFYMEGSAPRQFKATLLFSDKETKFAVVDQIKTMFDDLAARFEKGHSPDPKNRRE